MGAPGGPGRARRAPCCYPGLPCSPVHGLGAGARLQGPVISNRGRRRGRRRLQMHACAPAQAARRPTHPRNAACHVLCPLLNAAELVLRERRTALLSVLHRVCIAYAEDERLIAVLHPLLYVGVCLRDGLFGVVPLSFVRKSQGLLYCTPGSPAIVALGPSIDYCTRGQAAMHARVTGLGRIVRPPAARPPPGATPLEGGCSAAT